LRVNHVYRESFTDGPGARVVVRVQGCPHRCPGCFVPETHPFQGGRICRPCLLAETCARRGWKDGLTVTGGEPFSQPDLACFLLAARKLGCPHIVLYSGYTLEHLLTRPPARAALALADVLVDGPFVQDLDDPHLAYRGSRNQRVLDLPATRASGRPVCLDWDTNQSIVIANGIAVVPYALLPLAEALGIGTENAEGANCAGGKCGGRP
jgi:anaerobic ribonucleoside-triphosphate reductase activating protein